MFRKFYALLFFAFVITNLNAGNVDLLTARKVAEAFVKSHIPSGTEGLRQSSTDFIIKTDGVSLYYIINLNPKGFIIIPAFDAAPPVLGYSLENNYQAANQPENFSLWMDGYSKSIQYLIENNIQSDEGNKAHWEDLLTNSNTKSPSSVTTVGPLIPCTWNQGSPYNYLCPADAGGPGGHVYAGCVATAMSQVMYYWRYPQQGTGSHGYTYYPYGYLFADFGSTTYHWEEMISSTNSQNFEMAQLQSHLGVSVNMMYSPDGSGAYSNDAADALKNYFGYDQSLQLVYKDNYTYEDWKTLLQSQVDAGQPMYYHGYGTGGHAFNVDGYQDTMFFHFNWGWGGSYNGYFHLFNLNPGGNSFTDGQGAIINFFPAGNNVNQCGIVDTLTMLAGTMEDGSGPVAPYFNNSACSWLILPGDTLENIKLTFQRFDLEANKDFIYVYDGANTDAALIGSYTGNEIPPAIVATSGSMFIQFITDGNGTSNGWLASYTAKQAAFCSSNITLLTAPSGRISDGSGSFDYRNKSICRYKIKPAGAQSFSLTFNEFNTAGESDYLEIYNLETQTLLHKFYGQTNPGIININAAELYLVFSTDQQNTASGWDLSYTSSELTGLKELNNGIAASIFPNPAQSQIHVNLNTRNKENYTLKLISSEGVPVFTKTFKSGTDNAQIKIDVISFARGIYTLQIISEEGSMYQKVVLN
jgi:hypothetical protein